MYWYFIYIVIFAFALLLTSLFTPLFIKIAKKLGIVDIPSKERHKNHAVVIPLMGGSAMFVSWIITIISGLLFSFIFINTIPDYIAGGIIITHKRILVIVIGAMLMTLLGLADDIKPFSAKLKFLGQFLIAAFVVTFAGIKASVFINSEILTWILSVFWFLVIINAFNFFDNMDGLAAGIASIAFFFFAVIAIIFRHYFIASLSSAGFGVSLGFWLFNKTPAKIFMGDSGSHFLGYLLALTGVLTTYYQQGVTHSALAVFIPVFLLAIPLFDLLSVVVIRIKIKKPIYIGDNNHISHRFCKMGMNRKTAVLCVHILSIIVSLGVLPIIWGDKLTVFISLLQGCVILGLISVLQYSAKKDPL